MSLFRSMEPISSVMPATPSLAAGSFIIPGPSPVQREWVPGGARMRFLPVGRSALLVELGDLAAVLSLYADFELRRALVPRVPREHGRESAELDQEGRARRSRGRALAVRG